MLLLTAAALVLLTALCLGFVLLTLRPTHVQGLLLLVVAHPDDESTFFLPTIGSYAAEHVHILCLSNGDADGAGLVREKEMMSCCRSELGLPHANVEILSHHALQDGFETDWPDKIIAQLVLDKVKKLRERWPDKAVDVVTFDEHGVSSHPNHIAVYHGVKAMVRSAQAYLSNQPVQVKKLITEQSGFKYIGPGALIWHHWNPDPDVLVNMDMTKTYRAMQHHASQFLWYPYGYRRLGALFSRYSFVNRLNSIAVSTG